MILELGGSTGEGNGYPLQYSGLENPTDYTSTGLQSQSSMTDSHFTVSQIPFQALIHINSLMFKITLRNSVPL